MGRAFHIAPKTVFKSNQKCGLHFFLDLKQKKNKKPDIATGVGGGKENILLIDVIVSCLFLKSPNNTIIQVDCKGLLVSCSLEHSQNKPVYVPIKPM